jgi:hypothetical protein
MKRIGAFTSKSPVKRGLISTAFFLPSILMLISYCFAICNFTVVSSPSINQQYSYQSSENPFSYNTNATDLGEGNTTQGYRVENIITETRVNQLQNEVTKFMAIKNSFTMQTRHYGFISILKHNPINACIDTSILFHNLLI